MSVPASARPDGRGPSGGTGGSFAAAKLLRRKLLGRDRMLLALFLAAIAHAGLILGLPSPFPAPAERDTGSIAILLAPPPPEPVPPSATGDAAPLPGTPRPAAELPAEPAPVTARAPATPNPEGPPAESGAAAPPEPAAWRMRDYATTVREVALAGEVRSETSSRIRRVTGVSPASPELSYYFEAWRRKVERVGNLNYPDAARARSLYGSLRLLVAIVPDGTLRDVRVLESSGHRVLDDAALRIVRMAAPFAPFPPEMRRNTDVLEIVRTWQFRASRDGFSTL